MKIAFAPQWDYNINMKTEKSAGYFRRFFESLGIKKSSPALGTVSYIGSASGQTGVNAICTSL